MCGICGLAGRSATEMPLPVERLYAMTIAMTHRGPDEGGHLLDRGVALGMRRLSIIDLPGSHQPLGSEDGNVQTVFNGEIFNFRELRRELADRGHKLATAGDTETIVHLYEDHGTGFVDRLRGMFAIAIWDAKERKLVLVRDRLGVKPLYYAVTDSGLAFASEIKCLLAGGLVTPALDLEAAELFLTLGYVPGPRTLFEGVLKLPPATVLEWRLGELSGPDGYWSPADPAPFRSGREEEDEEHLLELLRSAVRARMVSDVPLGVMLSGGLDSSLIAALMAEASSGPIETFSVGFVEDADANELAWAKTTADRLGANHHELLTSATEHGDLLDNALWHLEEPIADLSFLGFLVLSRLARERVTVALCGQAADELLAGYPKHLGARVADLTSAVPGPLRRALPSVPGLGGGRSPIARLARVVASNSDPGRLLAMSSVLTPELGNQLTTAPWPEGPVSLLARSFALRQPAPRGASILKRTLILDQRLALPDLMFLYFDKMSMATSLEVRVPFADHDLVNFCMALPDARLFRRTRGKEILRRVARELVDDSIINRPKRGFFRAASSSWLSHNQDMVRETLLDPRCRERGLFRPAALRHLLDNPAGGGRSGEPLLVAFLLERWHRHFVDPDGPASTRVNAARQAARDALRPEPASS